MEMVHVVGRLPALTAGKSEQQLEAERRAMKEGVLLRHRIDPTWQDSAIIVCVMARLTKRDERELFKQMLVDVQTKDSLINVAVLFLEGLA